MSQHQITASVLHEMIEKGISLTARAAWLECVLAMFKLDTDRLTHSVEEFAGSWHCDDNTAGIIITELEQNKVAQVYRGDGPLPKKSSKTQVSPAEVSERDRSVTSESHGPVTPPSRLCHAPVTLVCHKLTKRLKARTAAAKRQERHRDREACHAPVTQGVTAVSRPDFESVTEIGDIYMYIYTTSTNKLTTKEREREGSRERKPDVQLSKKHLATVQRFIKQTALWFLQQTAIAWNRRLIATPKSVQPWIQKILAHHVTPAELVETIDWLCGANMEREFRFVVHSGESLFRKWDRIAIAMNMPDKRPVIHSFKTRFK